ncbi:MAG: hypothetical protein KC486_06220 [Myxococcales bacterium]|nr:hypothetical protein [Myxococcales bacterium]
MARGLRGVVELGVVVGLALLPGCLELGSSWDATTAGQTATSSATTSTTSAGTGTGAGTSTSTASSTSTSTGDSGTTGCSFLGCPEDQPVPYYQCDINAQDCPAGEKCNLWGTDGDWWNAAKCVPVVEDPDKAGEACTALQSGYSGIDTCEMGAICWDVDENNEGTCIAYCLGDWLSGVLVCPEGHFCEVSRVITLCMPICDPILQDCADGDLCLPLNEAFGCVLDGSGDAGAFGDPCEYADACDPGLVCLNPQYVPKCQAGGCCSPFCDTGAPNTCPAADMECLPWFDEGLAPPGLEHVGVCGIPQ